MFKILKLHPSAHSYARRLFVVFADASSFCSVNRSSSQSTTFALSSLIFRWRIKFSIGKF